MNNALSAFEQIVDMHVSVVRLDFDRLTFITPLDFRLLKGQVAFSKPVAMCAT